MASDHLSNENSSDINDLDSIGFTKLHHAVRNKKKKEILQVLSQGADCNIRSKNGETALHVAVEMMEISGRMSEEMSLEEWLMVVQELLICGADCNIRSYMFCYTPLHWAVKTMTRVKPKKQELELVRMMILQGGADPNVCDKRGRNSVTIAVSDGKPLDVITLLVDNGGELLAMDESGGNLLHHARRRESGGDPSEVIKFLMQRGYDLSKHDNNGNTPLHLMYNTDGISCMIQYGAEVDAQNNAGQTLCG